MYLFDLMRTGHQGQMPSWVLNAQGSSLSYIHFDSIAAAVFGLIQNMLSVSNEIVKFILFAAVAGLARIKDNNQEGIGVC